MHVYITVIFKDNWLRKNEPSKMAWLKLKCLFSLVPFTNVHTSARALPVFMPRPEIICINTPFSLPGPEVIYIHVYWLILALIGVSDLFYRSL